MDIQSIDILEKIYDILIKEKYDELSKLLRTIISNERTSGYNENSSKDYIDICHKIKCICDKLFLHDRDKERQSKILQKSFEYILSIEGRRSKLIEIIKNHYLKSNNKEYYLFEKEEDIIIDKITINDLDNRQFKHKKDLGFLGYESIKAFYTKSKCNKVVIYDMDPKKTNIDSRYKNYGKFLTNFCQGLDLDINFFFYDEKLFKSDEDYLRYIDSYFHKKDDMDNNIDEMRNIGNENMENKYYINNENIKQELNISNEDLVEYIDNFIFDDKSEKYNLDTQNINFIIEVLKKSFIRALDNKLLLDFIDKINPGLFDRFLDVEDIIIQHEAKIKSNLKKDSEAIIILEELLAKQEKQPDKFSLESYSETLNLLGASYKRYTFDIVNNLTENNGRTRLMIENLSKAREVYKKSFLRAFNDKYYPAINMSYLELIIGKVEKKDLDTIFDTLDEIWKNVKIEVNDYWSWFTDIEKNIIFQNYSRAKEKIKNIENELEKKDVNVFNIDSTVRQLKLYSEFCDEEDQKELSEICTLLDSLKESL